MRYRVRAFFNQDARYEPWQPGQALRPSIVPPLKTLDLATGPEGAADDLWAHLNADRRPNGAVECSLSIGDVVAVQAEDGAVFVLACDRDGFTAIPLALDVDQPWEGPEPATRMTRDEAIKAYEDRKELLAREPRWPDHD